MIVVIGSYGAGITARVPRIPLAGETIADSVVTIGHGGKGSNQAVAMSRQGAAVEIVTALGKDSFADAATALWKAEGVAHQRVKFVDQTSTMSGVILVEPSGENRIAIAPGALDELRAADIDAVEDVIANADLVVTCLEIPVPTVERAIQLAHKHGTPIVVNPAPAAEMDYEILAQADYFIPNETEQDFYLEQGYQPPAEQVVITTRGAEGVTITQQGQTTHVPGFKQQRVVDTTGAGDTFVGNFAAGIDRGLSVVEAAQRAVVASSLSVTIEEVIPSIPTRSQVDDALTQYLTNNN